MQSLKGRVILVTGGSRGIGAATARELAAQGAAVMITARNQDLLARTAAEIQAAGGTVAYAVHDVCEEASWAQVIARTVKELGALHGLVNNAGVHQIRRIEDTRADDFDWLVNTNLKGAWLGCRLSIPVIRNSLAEGQTGTIVNVSSVAGLGGGAAQSLYGMTKGGLEMFSKSLAMELAMVPITVNTVCPGVVETDMGDSVVQQLVDIGILPDSEDAMAIMRRGYPNGRFATPEDVANTIRFLVSPEASYITGTSVPVDGGFTAR